MLSTSAGLAEQFLPQQLLQCLLWRLQSTSFSSAKQNRFHYDGTENEVQVF